jgi:hypothetical protein
VPLFRRPHVQVESVMKNWSWIKESRKEES